MASSSGKSKTYRFLEAAMTGNLSVLKRLANELDVGEGLAKTVASIKNPNGHTAFHYAAMAGKTHVCKYLVEELKLDIDMKDRKGIFDVLYYYYPRRLGQVLFVEAPFVFKPVWQLFKPLVKSYASLVRFCCAETVRKEYFTEATLPASFRD